LAYTARRRQFGVALDQHQLVRRQLTEMIVATRAARLLCLRAGYVRQAGDPLASSEALVAKYFASRTASRVAGWAVQLHGAAGTSREHPVARHLRDAKVMEIIEGSNEIQQLAIAGSALAEL
jgi:alkylation response protein AidB-like acyl-CoA dehydrogenase